jgi:aryl-alcohol dehydrogenase-like predicted oxidoreductase
MHKDRCVLGTVGLGGVWGKIDPQESVNTLLQAMEQGIRAVDTAPAYGDAETYVGKALRLWGGDRPRISTKVGRLKSYAADEGYYDFSVAGMQHSVEESLKTLGVSDVDILFLHDPHAIAPADIEGVLETLQDFKKKGYARQIGLGGNPPGWFQPYLKPEIFDVLMEFNKLNACSTIALEENLPRCLNNKMKYFAASPLNMGLLGSCYESFTANPPAWLDIKYVKTAIRINEIADRNHIALRALAHRFLLSIPLAFQIVIGPSNRQQLELTLGDLSDGPLPNELFLEIINSINKKEIHV